MSEVKTPELDLFDPQRLFLFMCPPNTFMLPPVSLLKSAFSGSSLTSQNSPEYCELVTLLKSVKE